ncbi:putative flavin-containing monooxygenase [Helianthus annuus]|nr:putative flavin-containing monooxygenase [Helianthus annuus]
MEKKQIAIIGAGIGGLLACKYCLSKGFNPIVFDFGSEIGGVWARTIKTTRLQIPKAFYQFSDFPWPASVTDEFPTQQEMIDYIRSYANHFNLMPHIKFHSLVKGISYDGPSSDAWSVWNGTGEAFPPEGKWNVTVEDTKTATTKVYTVDFVILCVGRFKDVPNMPKFPAGKGLEVFSGKAIHSQTFAEMDHDAAAEMVKGKRVVVVGFGKSGLDIARECADINGPENPCTIVYRRDHWKVSNWYPMGIPFVNFIFSRFTMLMVHKPGEGLLLSLLATLLSPLICWECIHPRIPQLAIIGFSDAVSSLFISETRCKWLTALLEGSFKLPTINEMQIDITRWDEYMKQSSGEDHHRSFLGAMEIWYNDQLCKDMGVNPMRKKGLLANLFEAHGPIDYAQI